MPRLPRTLSNTGIYHIMVRGINKKDIFNTPGEKQKYINTLRKMGSEGEFTLYGYCIMNNHAHLLIKEEGEPIHLIMKRIGVSYVYYYNKKYDRVGPLFQGRYRSERIEDERYLIACLRYIHNNPVKANICKKPEAYQWSSYRAYIKDYLDEDDIINRDFVLEIYSDNKTKAMKELARFTKGEDELTFIDIDDFLESIDPNLEIIENIENKYSIKISEIKNLKDKNIRNKYIAELREKTSLTLREVSGLTGISKSTIGRL